MYLLAFWNLIPTAMAHRNACKRDAGFQAFVEPAEWIASHQDRIDRMKGIDPNKVIRETRTKSDGVYRYAYMGGLLVSEEQRTGTKVWGLGLGRLEMRIVDADTHQVLALAVDYGLSSREDVRIWLTRGSCFTQIESPISRLTAFNQQLKGVYK